MELAKSTDSEAVAERAAQEPDLRPLQGQAVVAGVRQQILPGHVDREGPRPRQDQGRLGPRWTSSPRCRRTRSTTAPAPRRGSSSSCPSSRRLLPQVFTGLVLGMIFVLLAIGLSLIFGLMTVVNFAHGALYMLGAYFTVFLLAYTKSFWVALLVAPLMVGAIGLAHGALPHPAALRTRARRPAAAHLRPLPRAHRDRQDHLGQDRAHPRSAPGARRAPSTWASWRFPAYRLFVIAVTVVVLIGLWAFLDAHQRRAHHPRGLARSADGPGARHRPQAHLAAGLRHRLRAGRARWRPRRPHARRLRRDGRHHGHRVVRGRRGGRHGQPARRGGGRAS